MSVISYNTWNPILQVQVLDGAIPSELLLSRTLEFTYYDRMSQFDNIEWRLDNRDGILTRPESLAAGILIRLRLGYNGAEMPWRTMIINRVRGGLGVFGRPDPAVGSEEGVITFHGRNRNAAGGKVPNPNWRKTAPAPRKKPAKIYGPTMSGQTDLLVGRQRNPRIIEANTVYDAILQICRRNGFEGPFALIQDPQRELPTGRLVIPEGQTDGQFLASLAADQPGSWMFKIDGDYLHFHEKTWSGSNLDIVDDLVYGAGPDILSLTIDADFNLPLPRSIKVKSINPRIREVSIYEADKNMMQGSASISTVFMKNFMHPAREEQIRQDLVFTSLAANVKELKQQAIDAFVARHMRAFQINLRCVGNPRLLAGRTLRLSGVGNPLADGRWLIKEARHHIVSGTSLVYTTEVHLGPPAKSKARGEITEGTITDTVKNMAQGHYAGSTFFSRGLQAFVGKVRRGK